MFTKLLIPFVTKTYPVTIEEIRHQEAKEKRIIDTLEPLMQQHRLIIDTNVVHKDYNSSNEMYSVEKALRFQLFYQMSRIGRIKGSLAIDDRLDVLSMACRYWVDQLSQDPRGTVIDYKMTDGRGGIGVVLKMNDGSKQWFFEDEIS